MLPPRLLAVGSSTGGPQALAAFFKNLRPLPIPVAIVQHMPAGFTTMLADHLDKLGVMPCAEAKHGEVMQPGRIYLAPGDHHLTVDAGPGDTLVAKLDTGPQVNYCRPAVDPMLQSASRVCSGRVLAVILTGMGQDGLEGCRSLVAKGGAVFAQDEASSVVWGMPGAVSRAGIASLQSPPEVLAERVLEIFKLPGAKT
jgi:two-component system chemotaxis response regulator CheB